MKYSPIFKSAVTIFLTLLVFDADLQGQAASDTAKVKKYQAKAPKTQPFGQEAFTATNKPVIRWTGNAGFFNQQSWHDYHGRSAFERLRYACYD